MCIFIFRDGHCLIHALLSSSAFFLSLTLWIYSAHCTCGDNLNTWKHYFYNNNNINNNKDRVDGTVVMTQSLQEFSRFV